MKRLIQLMLFVAVLVGTVSQAAAVNVREFGVKGDGVADDTFAIQKAMDSVRDGGTLYFPPGVYLLSKAVNGVGLSQFELIGDRATLRIADNAPNTKDHVILHLAGCSDFKIRGLTFDGNIGKRGGREGTNTVRLYGCQRFTITRNSFHNAVGDHLYFGAGNPAKHETGCRDGLVQNNVFDGAYRNAISVIHAYRLKIAGNRIVRVDGVAPAAAIDIEPNKEDGREANHDIEISDNSIDSCAGFGVIVSWLGRSKNITIRNNDITRTAYSIVVSGENIRVADNTIRDVSRRTKGTLGSDGMCAIYVQYRAGNPPSDNIQVKGNLIKDTKGISGIVVAPDATNVSVTDNTLLNLAGPVEHPWTGAVVPHAARVQNNRVAGGSLK